MEHPAPRLLHVTRERGSDARYGIRKSLLPVVETLREKGVVVDIHDGQSSDQYLQKHPLPGIVNTLWQLFRRYHRWRDGRTPAAENTLAMVEERLHIAWTAAARVLHEGHTHIHCHDPILAWLYHHLQKKAPPRRIFWGYTSHGFGMFVQPRLGIELPAVLMKTLQRWERQAALQADWLCAPTQAGLEQLHRELQQQTGWKAPAHLPPHWHAVPHPRPFLEQPDWQTARQTARQQLSLPPGAPLILAAGQLIPLKRHDWLIDTLSELNDPDAHLLILGEGPEAEKLRQLARARGIANRYHQFPSDDIRPWLAAADIYASASSTESWGMANCEALAAGLPSACIAAGATSEVLGTGALLVDNNKQALTKALNHLLTSPELCQQQARQARERAKSWKNAGQIADQMNHIYQQAAAQPRRSSS